MKLLKYGLLTVLALNGVSCLGMEQKKEEKKQIHLDQFDIVVNVGQFNSRQGNQAIAVCCKDKTNKAEVAIANLDMWPNGTKEVFGQMRLNYESSYKELFDKYQDKRGPIVYLSYFKIWHNNYKGQGLGTQFFVRVFQEIKRLYPDTIFYFWYASALDGAHKKEDLLRFYRNRGGIELKKELLNKKTKEQKEQEKNVLMEQVVKNESTIQGMQMQKNVLSNSKKDIVTPIILLGSEIGCFDCMMSFYNALISHKMSELDSDVLTANMAINRIRRDIYSIENPPSSIMKDVFYIDMQEYAKRTLPLKSKL
jgi:hypothetical protein